MRETIKMKTQLNLIFAACRKLFSKLTALLEELEKEKLTKESSVSRQTREVRNMAESRLLQVWKRRVMWL